MRTEISAAVLHESKPLVTAITFKIPFSRVSWAGQYKQCVQYDFQLTSEYSDPGYSCLNVPALTVQISSDLKNLKKKFPSRLPILMILGFPVNCHHGHWKPNPLNVMSIYNI